MGNQATGKFHTPTLTLPHQGGGDKQISRDGNGRPPHDEEILALRRVTFAYPGAAPVLNDFSLAFREGELTAVLGTQRQRQDHLAEAFAGAA